MAHFMEVVFVELAHEAGEVAVLEVLRKDVLGEFLVLASPLVTALRVPWSLAQRTSSTTKLSPSFPHRTTFSSVWFSSILFGASAYHPTWQARYLSTYLYNLRTWSLISKGSEKGVHGTDKVARAVRSRALRLIGIHAEFDPQPRSLAPPSWLVIVATSKSPRRWAEKVPMGGRAEVRLRRRCDGASRGLQPASSDGLSSRRLVTSAG